MERRRLLQKSALGKPIDNAVVGDLICVTLNAPVTFLAFDGNTPETTAAAVAASIDTIYPVGWCISNDGNGLVKVMSLGNVNYGGGAGTSGYTTTSEFAYAGSYLDYVLGSDANDGMKNCCRFYRVGGTPISEASYLVHNSAGGALWVSYACKYHPFANNTNTAAKQALEMAYYLPSSGELSLCYAIRATAYTMAEALRAAVSSMKAYWGGSGVMRGWSSSCANNTGHMMYYWNSTVLSNVANGNRKAVNEQKAVMQIKNGVAVTMPSVYAEYGGSLMTVWNEDPDYNVRVYHEFDCYSVDVTAVNEGFDGLAKKIMIRLDDDINVSEVDYTIYLNVVPIDEYGDIDYANLTTLEINRNDNGSINWTSDLPSGVSWYSEYEPVYHNGVAGEVLFSNTYGYFFEVTGYLITDFLVILDFTYSGNSDVDVVAMCVDPDPTYTEAS